MPCLASLSLALSAGCVTSGRHEGRPIGALTEVTPLADPPHLCAAIRGNGELVMAHFASLGALVEKLGVFDGLAGGSSASVTIFLYESILRNPAIADCRGEGADVAKACAAPARAARVSLLLKSLPEYLEVLGETQEAKAIFGASKFLSVAQEKGIFPLLFSESETKVLAGIGDLRAVLNSPEIGDLLNPELRDMVSPTGVLFRTYRAREAFASLSAIGQLSGEDKKVFFRPGPIHFQELARKLGRLGNFLAGYPIAGEPRDADPHRDLRGYLDRCTPLAQGVDWFSLKEKDATCAQEIHGLMARYRARLLGAEDRTYSRTQDPVGGYVHALVATSVLEAPATKRFAEGFRRFMENDGFEGFEFKVYPELKYGYWGGAPDLTRLMANPKAYADLRTRKRRALPPAAWETVLALSPAEPGLSRVRPIEGTELSSAGGWPDLSPVLALKNIGCEKVVYVTREGEDSPFGQSIARTLGATDAEQGALYNLKNSQSSFATSLREADAVWCTNWDGYSAKRIPELVKNAHRAPLISKTDKAKRKKNILGCWQK